MESAQLLKLLGFTEKEAGVYLALLELGPSTGYAVASKTLLKRPTVYVVLDNLEKRGMVVRTPHSRGVLFATESPEKLLRDISKKYELLKRGLPDLTALYEAKKEKPQMQLLQGEGAVKDLYGRLFQSKELWLIGTARAAMTIYPGAVQDFLHRVQYEGLKVRELLARSDVDKVYIKKAGKTPHHEIRLIPEGMDLHTDCAISGNTVVFFSYKPLVVAVVVRSNDIADLMRTVFNIAWLACEPV